MDDTISRQMAIDAICEHGTDLERRGITVLSVANHKQATVDLLEKLPSAERHGRWEQDYKDKWRCSVCKVGNNYAYAFDAETKDYTILQDKYCPNCGAKMDDNAIQHTERVENALGALDEVE